MSTHRKAKAQRSLWEGNVDLDVRSLWEPWMSGDSGEGERSFRREAERHSGMIPNTIGA